MFFSIGALNTSAFSPVQLSKPVKNTGLLIIIGILGFLGLAACSSGLETSRVPVSASSGISGVLSPSEKTTTDRLEDALNRYRASIGRQPIPRHPGLDAMARRHCDFMARNRGKFSLGSKNISHYGFEERALLAKRRYGLGHCSENVAGGMIPGDIPSRLVGAWTTASDHAYNLKQDWHATGIGIQIAADGYVYAVQIFATKGISKMGYYDRLREF